MNARSILSSLATVTFLLSASASATYAADADASAAPAMTRLDTTPIGDKGNGRITGHSTVRDVGLSTLVYVYRATPYTKWFFNRVFDEWDTHKPNTPWPVMDDRARKTAREATSDDDGYFNVHNLPEGSYLVVQLGDSEERTSFYSRAYHVFGLLTVEPVSVTSGKVSQVDRSDEREVDQQCPDHEDFASRCKDLEFTPFITLQ